MRYEYDVALSYAGENEAFVRRIYRYLIAADLKVFFAPKRAGHLWGKDQREFQRVYGPASRFVVPFISEPYATKEWPQLEFSAASKEAKRRADDFLLPVRLDSTRMRGLPRRLQYLDGRRFKAKAIAKIIIEEKVGGRDAPTPVSDEASRRRVSVRLIPSGDAELLGLVATSILPVNRTGLRRLAPGVDWSAAVSRWRRQGLMAPGPSYIEVSRDVRRKLFAAPHAEDRAHQRWIELLLPLRNHPDTAFALGVHYLCLRQIRAMLDVLIPVAESLDSGFWSKFYLRFFERFASATSIRKAADAKAWIRFLNSFALLLTHSGRYADARAQFAKVRALSKRTGNAWGEGQSYINAGVAAAHSGATEEAIEWYEKAVTHARRHRDYWLLGRALGNLAHFRDADTAAKLIDESERIKSRVGDTGGLAAMLITRGNLAAASRRFVAAGQFYRRAVSLARQLGDFSLEALALRNLGRTEIDRRRPKKAVSFYRTALVLAEEEELSEQLPQVLAGLAIAHAEAREFGRAKALLARLVAVHKSRGDRVSAIVALHDVGTIQVQEKRESDAYSTFCAVIDEARRAGLSDWVYRAQISAASATRSDKIAVRLLRSARTAATRAQDFGRAVSCSIGIADRYLRSNQIEAALHERTTAIAVAPEDVVRMLLAEQLTLLIRANASVRRIASAFRRVVSVAKRAGDQERIVDAHMELGDALWRGETLDKRANAYQAFAAALPAAAAMSIEAFARVGAHAATKLHSLLRHEHRLHIIDAIERKTRIWLRRQKAPSKHDAFFLWPIRFARRLLQHHDLGKELSKRTIALMLTDEIRQATGLSTRVRHAPRTS